MLGIGVSGIAGEGIRGWGGVLSCDDRVCAIAAEARGLKGSSASENVKWWAHGAQLCAQGPCRGLRPA